MEGLGFPGELPWWGPESYPPGPRIPTEASRGGLGPPSLLWDHMCRAECPTTTVNGSRTIRPGPLVREELNPTIIKAKRYTVLTDEVLKDPFDPVELSVHSNKVVTSEEMDSPPCLFPAFTTQLPPAEDGPCHTLLIYKWKAIIPTPYELLIHHYCIFTLNVICLQRTTSWLQACGAGRSQEFLN